MMNQGIDLSHRWETLLEEICEQTKFIPESLGSVRMSQWWRTGKIGAVSINGTYTPTRKPAVLKIQGSKPKLNEVKMIEAFNQQNKSTLIRAPYVYEHIDWDTEKQFEAIVFEKVEGREIISTKPVPSTELKNYFELYQDYSINCVNDPWIEQPTTYSYKKQYDTWYKAVSQQRETDTLAEPEDEALTKRAIELIEQRFTAEDLTFQHGHFQPGDLILTPTKEVVLFSNLFWSYRIPYYDGVFGYHWMMLGMEHVDDLSEDMLEAERQKWFSHLFSLPGVAGSQDEKHKLLFALLERAVLALMIDRFMVNADPQLDRSNQEKIIVKAARNELSRLLIECETLLP